MSYARDSIRHAVGVLAEFVFPNMAAEIDSGHNTSRAPKLKRAIMHARLRRARARGDHDAVEKTLSAFWRSDAGDAFHQNFADMRFDLFTGAHRGVLEAVRVLVENDSQFVRLVEIGCGDGRVVAHCARQLPTIKSFVGIDINEPVIGINSKRYDDVDGLSFACSDGQEWLATTPQPGTVVLTNGGVFEYLSPEKFDALLQSVATHAPAAVALIEPVAPEHDLERENKSLVFGRENSFSHNHRYRLIKAGFDVRHYETMTLDGVKWVLALGVCSNS